MFEGYTTQKNVPDKIFSKLHLPFLLLNPLKGSWPTQNKEDNEEWEATGKYVMMGFRMKWKKKKKAGSKMNG